MYNVTLNCSRLLLVFLALLISACSTENEQLRQTIYTLDTKALSTGSYVVIPNQGCDGCISTAEAFVKKHIADADSIRYIFTRIASVKLLKVKLGYDVIASSKVLLDTANLIRYPDKKKEIYPMIVHLRDQQITTITYQSPEADGIGTLLKE
jgi:hypothetical protein